MDELLDTAPCGFLTLRDDGTVVRVNRTLLEMLGYDREEVQGHHVEGLMGLGSRIFYQTHLFPLVRMHGHAREIFLTLRPKGGGDDLGVLLNAVRREREAGHETDCVVVPVRERRKYEDELLRARRAADRAREEAQEASRAKSRFVSHMSHELRTPLNAIAGYVEILDMGIHGPVTEAQREALERIGRSQRHVLRLINGILNVGRIEAGQLDFRDEPVPLVDVVAAVRPMVEPQLHRKSLELRVEVAPEVMARADREKVEQILLNLLGNAAKFTPSGGWVAVDASVSPDEADREHGVRPGQAVLRVRDSGVGIAAEDLPKVFEAFVQVGDREGEGSGEGSGLGLAISRDLARGMGGDLWAESVPGEGSTFTLVLPLAEAVAREG